MKKIMLGQPIDWHLTTHSNYFQPFSISAVFQLELSHNTLSRNPTL